MINQKDDIVFEDREDAGRQLGKLLERSYKSVNPLVLGVPRGGVVVASYVAKALDAKLGIVIAKKLSLPGLAQVGFGAIAEDLSVYISAKHRNKLLPEVVGQIIDQQTDEINRRVQQYRKGQPFPDMKGRIVIVVDDGIATGVTLVPIVRLCRKSGAARVIIAVPVAGKNYDGHLNEADALEILCIPEWFYAVGQVYMLFKDLSDEQMLAALENWAKSIK